jgi:uncharacterized protein YbjT (DUF2867 family)
MNALAAAPDTGVNTVTGEGLEAVQDGAAVVIDLANSRSFEPSAAMDFFTAHEKNLLAAEARAGVRHHVVLSIVGCDRSPDNGYFQAKVVEEELIKGSGIPLLGHSLDAVHGVPRKHCRCRPEGRCHQHRDRPVSADRHR